MFGTFQPPLGRFEVRVPLHGSVNVTNLLHHIFAHCLGSHYQSVVSLFAQPSDAIGFSLLKLCWPAVDKSENVTSSGFFSTPTFLFGTLDKVVDGSAQYSFNLLSTCW